MASGCSKVDPRPSSTLQTRHSPASLLSSSGERPTDLKSQIEVKFRFQVGSLSQPTQVVSIQITLRPLIVERDQAELRQKVDEPAPLELQLDQGEVEPGWDCPSVQQAAQRVSKIHTLLLITSFFLELGVLYQSLGQIKHCNDIATKKFLVCDFLPQPCGKLTRPNSMRGIGGGKTGQPSSCALTKLRS